MTPLPAGKPPLYLVGQHVHDLLDDVQGGHPAEKLAAAVLHGFGRIGHLPNDLGQLDSGVDLPLVDRLLEENAADGDLAVERRGVVHGDQLLEPPRLRLIDKYVK